MFLAAATLKWLDLAAFARSIDDFGLVWPDWERPAAVAVSVLEAIAGLLLFANRRLGYTLTAVMLGGFTAVIAYGLALDLDIDCGCLGPVDQWAKVTLEWSLVRALALLAALAVAWRTRRAAG